MPDAWCTTYWKSAPASSSAANIPGRRAGLEQQHRFGGDVGHHQRVGVLLVGQGSDPVAVEVEGAEPDGTHPQREPEDGASAGLDRRAAERQPPRCARVGEVGLEHRSVLVVGVDARTLAEVVLQTAR